jgi:hypothetical protein
METICKNNKHLLDECNKGVHILVDKGAEINFICKLIKNYQKMYLFIKDQEPRLVSGFTFDKYIEKIMEDQE